MGAGREILEWNPEPGQKSQNPEPGPENFQIRKPARNFSKIVGIFFQIFFFLFIIRYVYILDLEIRSVILPGQEPGI